MTSRHTVLVLGATGFLGRHIVPCLAAAGHSVLCHGRAGETLRQLWPDRDHRVFDVQTMRVPGDWTPRLVGCTAVVNAVGALADAATLQRVQGEAPLALVAAARAAGIRRFLQISALGADPAADTLFLRSKGVVDAEILRDRPPGWVVLRPSLVYGPDGRSARLFQALAALPVLPGLGGGLVRPVSVEAVAEAVRDGLDAAAPLPPVLPVVGGEELSATAYVQRFRSWLGWRPAPVMPIPRPILHAAGWAGDLVGAPLLGRAALRMLEHGATADPAALRRHTGVGPVSVAAGLARRPATRADRLAARLYFLLPPLRVTMALLWIVTGVLSVGVYPVADSLDLVAQLGVTGPPALALLFGGAAADLALGMALLLRFRPRLIGALMLGVMAVYSLLITLFLSAWWLHPFGPLTKNIPLAAATLVVMAAED